MDLVTRGASGGALIDIDQLIEDLYSEHNWETTKPSIQFSLRILINHGLIEKRDLELRRGRHRRCFEATDSGFKFSGKSRIPRALP